MAEVPKRLFLRVEQVEAARREAVGIEAMVIRALGSKQDVAELSEPLPEVTR